MITNILILSLVTLCTAFVSTSWGATQIRPDQFQFVKINAQGSSLSNNQTKPAPYCKDGTVEHAIICGARDTFNHPGVHAAGITEREWRELIRALIWKESRFQPNVRSHMGAYGLTQLMPQTARAAGLRSHHLKKPYYQVKGGGVYLASMLKTFDGDISQALAGYNAGPGNVRKYKGIPPFRETQIYVRDIMEKYRQYKKKVQIRTIM